jgi:2-polyprenyl-6-methoxyphenol hydroxylase-like FAD-dependent oxidoreductase
MESDLLIIGAGPVGTCLAIDAAQRGLNVTLVEARRADEPPDAKCNTIASRTMETFRRFGISRTVRDAGLLDDYPTDTVYAVALRGPELTRIRMPSRIERGAQGFHDSAWLTPEGMVRQSQLFLEPILRERLLKEANVQFLPRHSLTAFTQDDTGVHAICTHDGRETSMSARYLIGCDGGASFVRKTLDINFWGMPS